MTSEEQETIILINRSEMKKKYFRFYTCYLPDREKLIKRVGYHNLIDPTDVIDYKTGRVIGIQCLVPSRFLSKSHWGIRKPTAYTDAQKDAMTLGLRVSRGELD